MKVKTITVVGGGTAGSLTVFFLLKKIKGIKINWIFPENNIPIGVGEATIPSVCDFLIDLGISYEDIINKLGGGIKLGIEFENFNKKESFIHPFGSSPKRYLQNSYYIKNNLINKGLFNENLNFAFHFDVRLLIDFLYEKILKYKNITIKRELINNIKSDKNGNILSVNGINSDFFIDCTGFNKELISKICKNNFIKSPIINNSCYVYRENYVNKKTQQKNCTSIIGMSNGWLWKIPLLNKLSLGYIHNNKSTLKVKNEFKKIIKKEFGNYDDSKLLYIKFKTGRNKKHLFKNVFCIGLSSAFIEPMESTGLYFISENIKHLYNYFNKEISSTNLNNSINNDYDSVMNFILAHYKYSDNTNEYWDYFKTLDVELFKKNGLFSDYNWYFILKGLVGEGFLSKNLPYNRFVKYELNKFKVLYKLIIISKKGTSSYIDFINNLR